MQSIHAEDGKEIGGYLARDNSFSFAAASEVVAGTIVDAHLFKRLILVAPVSEVWIRDRHLIQHRTFLVEKNEPIGLFIRKWTQQHRVNNAEDRGVCADAEREGDDHDDRDARIF